MAITEKKQYCGGEAELTTTKICFTYPDASWVCKVSSFLGLPSRTSLEYKSVTKEPRESYDCLDDGVKLVAHEVSRFWIHLRKVTGKSSPCPRWRCLGLNARSRSRRTSASSQDVALSPTTQTAWPRTYPPRYFYTLSPWFKQHVCRCDLKTKCVKSAKKGEQSWGLVLFRSLQSPIVEKKKIIVKVMRVFQEETCDGSTFQEFCTTGVETNSKWSKTCSFPKTIRAQVLAEVLENTKEEENLIEVI